VERPAGRARLHGGAGDAEDNLLKEFMIAVSLLERRQNLEVDDTELEDYSESAHLEVAYPILLGRPHPGGHPNYPGMSDFFLVQAGGGRYANTPSPPSAIAAADFLQRRAGLDSAAAQYTKELSLAATMKALTALQATDVAQMSHELKNIFF